MNEKLGYPAAMRWNLEADATHHRALSVFNAVAAANGMSVLMAYDLPGTREKLRPDLIPGRPVCGELLIFPESAIRHTQVHRRLRHRRPERRQGLAGRTRQLPLKQ
jgi:hypothetical protein